LNRRQENQRSFDRPFNVRFDRRIVPIMTTHTMTTGESRPRVTAAPPAAPALAARHFQWRLGFETDPSDVHADLQAEVADFVVVDARTPKAYAAGHVPGAINLPHREIGEQTLGAIPVEQTIVVYCDGPACNAATRGAAALAALGYRVKEMIGGLEYWLREGFPVEVASPESHVA
jgi:rhodanese-related sulfurtransferase